MAAVVPAEAVKLILLALIAVINSPIVPVFAAALEAVPIVQSICLAPSRTSTTLAAVAASVKPSAWSTPGVAAAQ